MKKAVILVTCLASSWALAEDGDEMSTEVPEVSTRLEMIERIDVTAEKAPAESSEAVDTEVEAILREAEALEAEEE